MPRIFPLALVVAVSTTLVQVAQVQRRVRELVQLLEEVLLYPRLFDRLQRVLEYRYARYREGIDRGDGFVGGRGRGRVGDDLDLGLEYVDRVVAVVRAR